MKTIFLVDSNTYDGSALENLPVSIVIWLVRDELMEKPIFYANAAAKADNDIDGREYLRAKERSLKPLPPFRQTIRNIVIKGPSNNSQA